MQEKGVMLQDHSMRGPHKSGAKALMNTIMQLRSVHVKCDTYSDYSIETKCNTT